MHPFVTYLSQRLEHELPGIPAQKRMAPRFTNGEHRSFQDPVDAKKSAVLALLCLHESELSLLLTLRSRHLASHKGQFSFPGGRMEHGESVEQAALRETEEEVGIHADHIQVLGHLTKLYTPPSHSSIFPVVAWCADLPHFEHSPEEVEEIRFVHLNSLKFEHALEEERDYRGQSMTVPHWNIGHETPLWGATAAIIAELMSLYDEWLSGLV